MKIKVKKINDINQIKHFSPCTDYGQSLKIGDIFTVLTIEINLLTNRIYYRINDGTFPYLVLPDFFDIIDNSVSKYWVCRIENNEILLGPEEFLGRYFWDNVSNDNDELEQILEQVRSKLEIEANSIMHQLQTDKMICSSVEQKHI